MVSAQFAADAAAAHGTLAGAAQQLLNALDRKNVKDISKWRAIVKACIKKSDEVMERAVHRG